MSHGSAEQPLLGPELGATLNAIAEKLKIRRAVLTDACASGELRHSRINRKTTFVYWSDLRAWLDARSRGGHRSAAAEHAEAVLARHAERRHRRARRINGRTQ